MNNRHFTTHYSKRTCVMHKVVFISTPTLMILEILYYGLVNCKYRDHLLKNKKPSMTYIWMKNVWKEKSINCLTSRDRQSYPFLLQKFSPKFHDFYWFFYKYFPLKNLK